MLMLNSKILVGISLAVWNSFAAYQVARSTANGAMGDPKTYGYGLAFTTGLTALWIWSGIIKESEKTSGKIPRTMNSKLSPTLLAMEKAKWRSIIGMDFYTKPLLRKKVNKFRWPKLRKRLLRSKPLE
jgi:hypothetical protein